MQLNYHRILLRNAKKTVGAGAADDLEKIVNKSPSLSDKVMHTVRAKSVI